MEKFLDGPNLGNRENAVKNINNKELEMGILVEMEHTSQTKVARFIAIDHLIEFPDYYSRLAFMEKEADNYWRSKRFLDEMKK